MTRHGLRSRTARPRRLRIESLETRRCLDATMEMTGAELFIRGSLEADEIVIIDHGDGRVSASNSAVDGGRAVEFTGVGSVLVRSKQGSDTVRYSMLDPDRGVTDIVVCLGPSGENHFYFDAGPASSATGAAHLLTVNGGAENDQVELDFSQGAGDWTIHSDLRGGDDRFAANLAGNGLAGPHVDLDLRGGDGNDQFDLNFTRWSGETNLKLDLGAGDDHIAISLDFVSPSSPPGSDGDIIPCVRVALVAGAGSDDVTLNAAGGPAEIDIHADLGAGDDALQLKLAATQPPDSEIIPCVRVAISGGEGNDNAALDLRGYAGISDIDVDLGAGNDAVRVLADPPPEHFQARLRGGDGNDVIDVVFSQLGVGGGAVSCLLLGGAGDDTLSFDAGGNNDPNQLNARIDGGAGFDRARVSGHATVVHCEA